MLDYKKDKIFTGYFLNICVMSKGEKECSCINQWFWIFAMLLVIILWLNFVLYIDIKQDISAAQSNIASYITLPQEKTEIFMKRFENLEWKYIDVLASKETINWWFTILTILIPVTMWYTLFEKNKMMRKWEEEIEKIEQLKKDADTEIKDLKKSSQEILDKMEKLKNTTDTDIEEAKERLKQIEHEAGETLWEIEEKIKEAIIAESDKQNEISTLFSEALNFYKWQNYEEAISLWKDILILNPKYLEVYFNKGISLLWVAQNLDNKWEKKILFEEAIIDFNKVIRKSKDQKLIANSYWNRGLSFHHLGEYNKAILDYDEATKLHIKDIDIASVLYNKACLYALTSENIKMYDFLKNSEEKWYFKMKVKRENFYEDEDFKNYDDDNEFKAFVQKVKDKYWDE